MSNNNENFKMHLEEALTEINQEYKYIINWYTDIEKRNAPNNGLDAQSIDLNEKELFIVLTPNSSRSYGDNSKTMQMEMTLMCRQDQIADAIDILDQYQNGAVNNKYFTNDNVLVIETWYGPQIQENFIKFRVHKGAIITMNGSVSFTTDVVDVKRVLLFNQYNKTYEVMQSGVAESMPSNPTTSPRKKAINKSTMYKLTFKCKSANTIFCQIVRRWINGEESPNIEIPVKLIYTDDYEKEYKMVISDAVMMSTDSTIPTYSVSLSEKM